jgi:hypothetical protein
MFPHALCRPDAADAVAAVPTGAPIAAIASITAETTNRFIRSPLAHLGVVLDRTLVCGGSFVKC